MSRKSSARVTLVLIGVAALTAACQRGAEQRRDVYATREDCLADWGNKPQDCNPATDPKHASRGFWYGPLYGAGSSYTGSGWTSRTGSRSIGSSSFGSSSSSVSRGGFGSSAHSSGG